MAGREWDMTSGPIPGAIADQPIAQEKVRAELTNPEKCALREEDRSVAPPMEADGGDLVPRPIVA